MNCEIYVADCTIFLLQPNFVRQARRWQNTRHTNSDSTSASVREPIAIASAVALLSEMEGCARDNVVV